jgi:hypothetical protein
MKLIRFLLIVWLLSLVACQTNNNIAPTATVVIPIATSTVQPTATIPPPTATTEPTQTPLPTITATDIPTLTPEPSRTTVPTPTPIPALSTKPGFNFRNQGGIVLPLGRNGSWDDANIFQPHVFVQDGTWHMFYVGFGNSNQTDGAIGYATSSDGVSWVKNAGNPVLEGTETYRNLVAPAVVFDGTQWLMYVNGGDNGTIIGPAILRATAPSPEGPWAISETPVMEQLTLRQWDRKSQPMSLFNTAEGLRMYYMGIGGVGLITGMATATDGINWSRYNNPATDDRYGLSDPVITVGGSGEWDSAAAGSLEVMQTETGWEMFYVGTTTDPFAVTVNSVLTKKVVGFGFAASEDGISWEKHPDNPVIEILENCFTLLSTVKQDDTYYIYYDRECGAGGIGLLTGTIE